MRAIWILLFLTFIISGCTTIEVAKEVSKATESVKNTINKITGSEEKKQADHENQEHIESLTLQKEKQQIVAEKKKERALVKKQKNISEIKILGKNLDQLSKDLGEVSLERTDGDTKTARFDTTTCRLFIYFDLNDTKKIAKYYEIRNLKGDLLKSKEKINECFLDIKKV